MERLMRRLNGSLSRSVRRSVQDIFQQSPLDLRFALQKTLDPRITFTRASSGTFVGSDGLLKTATTNLLLRSEEFNDASWGKTGSTVTANATTAPNGTLTADKIVEDNSNGTHVVSQFIPVSGTSYVYSVYAKASERTKLVFSGGGFAAQGFTATFNLSNGTLDTNTGSKASIVAVGDGWYRCIVSFTASNATTFAWNLADASGSNTYLGNNTSGLFLWGAQLEQSPTVGEYVPTTSTINSAPRFDHSPTTGESLGLLVEEQRTNLLLQSNQFDTTWTNASSSETAAAGIAPDGTNTAWELKDTLDTVSTAHIISQPISFVSGTAYTFSAWMKAGTLSQGGVTFSAAAFGTTLTARVDLLTGAILASSANFATVVTPFPNGWYRITVTATTTATASASTQIRLMNGAPSYIGTGTGTILIWGAQLETGSFPTSYIPTTTAAATRSADVASITGANFSSWYRQDGGTMFANATAAVAASILPCYASIDNGTTSERLQLRRVTNGTSPSYRVVAGGQSIDSATKTIGSPTGFNSHVLAYASSNYEGACNGTLEGLTSIVNRPTATQLQIGNGAGSTVINGTIKRLTYWPVRLGNNVLQQITQ